MKKKQIESGPCETCCQYYYDEEDELYTCTVNLDQDELVRFIAGDFYQCPYYRLDDEYAIVRKQN